MFQKFGGANTPNAPPGCVPAITHSLSMTHSLFFPFSVLTALNVLFYRLHHLFEVAHELSRFAKWPVGQK